MPARENRRAVLMGMPAMAVAGALAGCGGNGGKEVGAVEDLMREHGILRRAILVFRESAMRLRDGGQVDPAALHDAARLFRSFGEDYHERKLEETYIFPALRKKGGPAAALVDVLIAQHNRGREIIDYVTNVTGKGPASGADTATLAAALDRFELMYANHAAREDTILFPAWKDALSARELDEMGDKFEDIEKQQFGGDGFAQAARRMDQIEQSLGLADLAQFTAPAPS
jgi:hemerythrin-like domain-containing protein